LTTSSKSADAESFTGPDPAERSAFNRLFYRNRRPTWVGHWVSQFFCWWARVGLPPVVDPAYHATGYLEKYSLMNVVKGLLIDRSLIGECSGRWLAIRSHYLNGPAFGGLVGTAKGFGTFLQDQLREQSVLFRADTPMRSSTPARVSPFR
jgi:hypothetical protein